MHPNKQNNLENRVNTARQTFNFLAVASLTYFVESLPPKTDDKSLSEMMFISFITSILYTALFYRRSESKFLDYLPPIVVGSVYGQIIYSLLNN